jgi:hypothetical protein
MKSWKFLENTEKNGRRTAFSLKLNKAVLSLFLLAFCGCSISTSPTYTRKDIVKAIESLCKKEFNISIKAWDTGNTLWIYNSYTDILDKKNHLSPDVEKNTSNIFLVIKRLILSTDNPPKFFAFVVSGTKDPGYDIYYIGYTPDIVKLEMQFISVGEFQNRTVIVNSSNPEAINDTKGDHLPIHDIEIGQFISYLCRQNLENEFSTGELKQYYQVSSVNGSYEDNTIRLNFKIQKIKDKEGLPVLFDEAKKIIKKLLDTYKDSSLLKDITGIEITDLENNHGRFYSIKTFNEEN